MFVNYEPRVIPLDEVQGTYGHGFLEIVYPPDEEGDAVDTVEECVWLNGEVLSQPEEGDNYNHYTRDELAQAYLRVIGGGMRIWDWIPTDEQRKAVKWDV